MKKLIFIGALMMTGAAIAQPPSVPGQNSMSTGSPAETGNTGSTVNDRVGGALGTGVPMAGDRADQPGADQQAAPQSRRRSNARQRGRAGTGGTGGTMGQGTMGQGTMGQSGSMGMGGAGMAGNYPPCSRTVTDRCIQTNERGMRRRR